MKESRTRSREFGWQVLSVAQARFSVTLGFDSGDGERVCMRTNEEWRDLGGEVGRDVSLGYTLEFAFGELIDDLLTEKTPKADQMILH